MINEKEIIENPRTYYLVFEYMTYPKPDRPAWESDLRMFDSVEQAERWIKAECSVNHKLRKSNFKITEAKDVEFCYE